MKVILKTLFLLFVIAVCLTSEHSHIISAAGLTRPVLINVLVLARKQ